VPGCLGGAEYRQNVSAEAVPSALRWVPHALGAALMGPDTSPSRPHRVSRRTRELTFRNCPPTEGPDMLTAPGRFWTNNPWLGLRTHTEVWARTGCWAPEYADGRYADSPSSMSPALAGWCLACFWCELFRTNIYRTNIYRTFKHRAGSNTVPVQTACHVNMFDLCSLPGHMFTWQPCVVSRWCGGT